MRVHGSALIPFLLGACGSALPFLLILFYDTPTPTLIVHHSSLALRACWFCHSVLYCDNSSAYFDHSSMLFSCTFAMLSLLTCAMLILDGLYFSVAFPFMFFCQLCFGHSLLLFPCALCMLVVLNLSVFFSPLFFYCDIPTSYFGRSLKLLSCAFARAGLSFVLMLQHDMIIFCDILFWPLIDVVLLRMLVVLSLSTCVILILLIQRCPFWPYSRKYYFDRSSMCYFSALCARWSCWACSDADPWWPMYKRCLLHLIMWFFDHRCCFLALCARCDADLRPVAQRCPFCSYSVKFRHLLLLHIIILLLRFGMLVLPGNTLW